MHTQTKLTKKHVLQGEVIPNFLLRELSESRLGPSSFSANLFFLFSGSRHSDNTNLNCFLCHLPLKTFFQSQKSSVYGVLQTDVVVISLE